MSLWVACVVGRVGGLCWPSVKRPAPRGNAPPRWYCWQVTGLVMLAPEKGEQRKGVRRVVQSAGKGRGRAASLCLSYFFASNRLTRSFGYALLADSATVGAPFGVVGVLSGFMALTGLMAARCGLNRGARPGSLASSVSLPISILLTPPCIGHPRPHWALLPQASCAGSLLGPLLSLLLLLEHSHHLHHHLGLPHLRLGLRLGRLGLNLGRFGFQLLCSGGGL